MPTKRPYAEYGDWMKRKLDDARMLEPGLSTTTLANRAGVSRTYVVNALNGINCLSPRVHSMLAETLRVTVTEMEARVGRMPVQFAEQVAENPGCYDRLFRVLATCDSDQLNRVIAAATRVANQ